MASDGEPEGIVAVVKRDCPTCELVVPVLTYLRAQGAVTAIFTQDDPQFPEGLDPIDDTSLERSYQWGVETVPTLARLRAGVVEDRVVGWSIEQWRAFTGDPLDAFGSMRQHQPGCGSKTLDPGMPERLAVRFGGSVLRARRVELASAEDDMEAMFERGWTDGLPVVPPTPERVVRMLAGTTRDPGELVAIVPPDLVECTVEKVAINAVMAGCKPEYLPIVLACVEAACTNEFNMHGLLATTYWAGPMIVVNGPIARAVGMNSGVNVFGPGNRANASIGRSLQLVVRNVGGGRPGGVDRATFGNPGKYTFCYAEDELGSPWDSLATERGVPSGESAVTLFAAEGPRGLVDQISRTPESLARSFAAGLRAVGHPKLVLGFDCFLAVSPEHGRVFRDAGWDKARLRSEILGSLQIPIEELRRGAGGIEEGVPLTLAGVDRLPKFRPDGLWFVHCGGTAGMFSSIIGGWVNGATGSTPVTHVIRT